MWRVRVRTCGGCVVLFLLSFSAATTLCSAQAEDVLCRAGSGNFDAAFQGGTRVHVGAVKSGGLATRTCEAILSAGEQNVVVATGAWEIDLDAFGADLGIGGPVAAFQVKESESACCRTYLIYSLQKPIRLLRTFTGGTAYDASDTDLDSRVEVWSEDGAAADGFENLALSEMDSPPPVVLRFEGSHVLDVGSEFQPYFDHLIADLRTQIDPQNLKDFRESDGKLKVSTAIPAEVMHRLRRVKIRILEIVWCYLYSGREAEAWSALAEMWPGTDLDRIRAEIVRMRDRGIRAQIDGVASTAARRKKHATIFDVTTQERGAAAVVRPQPILLRRPPPTISDQSVATSEILVDLLVDSAGKVRSVEPTGSAKSVDAASMHAAMGWKFIPALNGGHPVASRTRLAVSIRR